MKRDIEGAILPTDAQRWGMPARAHVIVIGAEGVIHVETLAGDRYCCDWLDTGPGQHRALMPGDSVLVVPPAGGQAGCVIGRIGAYRAPVVPTSLVVETTESLSLKCGEASIDLRADGKVMIRGEDVLVRAKGTQRIRAGTVSIN